MANIAELQGARRTFKRGIEEIRALEGVDLEIEQGDYLAIVGPSGSGKTTLLNLIGCMDVPTEGKVWLHGIDTGTLSQRSMAAIRSKSVGFVFQQFFLLPTLTALENVMLPAAFAPEKKDGVETRARELLSLVGLADRADHLPRELSGGEMQRVAVARALVNDPVLMLADEPTGNLDTESADGVTAMFERLNDDGLTIVVVTHNEELASGAVRIVSLNDGKITAEERRAPAVVHVLNAGKRAEDAGAPEEAPGYVREEHKRQWGSPYVSAALMLSVFLSTFSAFRGWITTITGLGFVSIYTYDASTYGGNYLVRTYHGKPSAIFTGLWPIIAAGLLLVAVAGSLFRARWAGWLALATGFIAGSMMLVNIIVIYALLQPTGLPEGSFVGLNPGEGIWLCLAASVVAVAAGMRMLMSPHRDRKKERGIQPANEDVEALVTAGRLQA